MDSEGMRLKEVIEASPYNNKGIAEETGIHPNYVSMMVNGKKNISDSFLFNLKKVIPDLNVDWIRTGNGQMTERNKLVFIDELEMFTYIYDNKKRLLENGELQSLLKDMQEDVKYKALEKRLSEIESKLGQP